MKIFFILFITLFLNVAHAKNGGSEVGNGTDNLPPEYGSAWFLGSEKKIHVCYKISPDFGASSAEVESAIKYAFETWADYLQERQVLTTMKNEFDLTFAFSLTMQASCNGQEDIRFEFGGTNPGVLAEKMKLENPTAFSVRESYDMNKGWGHGFVWLAPAGAIDDGFPNWSKGNELKLTLLHELGHVYGCPHVRGTVMDEFLSGQLKNHENLLLQVDQRNQLVFCWKCKSDRYSGRLGSADGKSEDTESQVFSFFIGKKPSGKISAELVNLTDQLNLVIQDSKSRHVIPLQFNENTDHTGFDRGERFFKAVMTPNANQPPKIFDFFNGGRVQYGSIKNAKGQVLNLAMEVNSHSLTSPGPYTLRWLDAGKAHSLFFANPR